MFFKVDNSSGNDCLRLISGETAGEKQHYGNCGKEYQTAYTHQRFLLNFMILLYYTPASRKIHRRKGFYLKFFPGSKFYMIKYGVQLLFGSLPQFPAGEQIDDRFADDIDNFFDFFRKRSF